LGSKRPPRMVERKKRLDIYDQLQSRPYFASRVSRERKATAASIEGKMGMEFARPTMFRVFNSMVDGPAVANR